MVTIKKYITIDGKRYTLAKAFVTKEYAKSLAKSLRREGYLARIVEKGGEMHYFKRYHIYIAKKKGG